MAAAHTAPRSLLHVVALLVQKPCTCPSLLSPASTGLHRLHSGKMQRLTQIGFLGMSLERQDYEENEHKTQAKSPPRKRGAGSTTHRQEILHHPKPQWPASRRAAAAFLSSACTSPRFHSSGGEVWLQARLPGAALPGTRPLGLELRRPLPSTPLARDACCTNARDKPLSRVLGISLYLRLLLHPITSAPSVEDYQYIYGKYDTTLGYADFLHNLGFGVCYQIPGVTAQTRGWEPGCSHCLVQRRKPRRLLPREAGNFCSGSSVMLTICISTLWILNCSIKRKLAITELKFKPLNYFLTVVYLFAYLNQVPGTCLPATQKPRGM